MDQYKLFLDKLFEKASTEGFNLEGLQLDHIAYYTASQEEYTKLKPKFEKLGKFEHEAIISNRRVGVIKLDLPFDYKNFMIEAVELIEPKEGEIHSSGWEHAEFVTDETFDSLLQKYPHVKWETGSRDRPIYTHITALLAKDLKLKFHPKSILECIELERKH